MNAKRIVLIFIGGLLFMIGIPLLILPGPGLLLMAVGIGIIVTQFRKPKQKPPDLSPPGSTS